MGAAEVDRPEYWETRYARGEDGWELGGPAPPLAALLSIGEAGPAGRLAVPGCGRGHEAIPFARHGFEVTGFDFAEAAIEAAAAGAAAAGVSDRCRFERRDLFELPCLYPAAFDAVVEHTCFCAIDPARRPEYVDVVASILKPGGRLLALFYPLRAATGAGDGPPFPTTRDEIDRLFGRRFDTAFARVPGDSIPRRLGLELLAVLVKRSTTARSPC